MREMKKKFRLVGDEDLYPTQPDNGCDDDREDENGLLVDNDSEYAGMSYMDFGDS
jgi:hypothetical protein